MSLPKGVPMPTDLSCPTCKGTGLNRPSANVIVGIECPDCCGSGIAAWAVEAAMKAIWHDWFDGITNRERAVAALAAVREEGVKRD